MPRQNNVMNTGMKLIIGNSNGRLILTLIPVNKTKKFYLLENYIKSHSKQDQEVLFTRKLHEVSHHGLLFNNADVVERCSALKELLKISRSSQENISTGVLF